MGSRGAMQGGGPIVQRTAVIVDEPQVELLVDVVLGEGLGVASR